MQSNKIVAYSLVGVAILLAIFGSGLFSGNGKPFCLFYPTFSSSLKTSNMTVNLQEYSGKWYEVAKKPNPFQSGCKCAIADYTFNKTAGNVEVANQCVQNDGSVKIAHGIATPYKKSDNTRLGVKFNGSYFSGAYFILDLDVNYEYVMVGEPCESYLWILSRKPTLAKSTINTLLKKAQGLGYETSDIMYREGYCQG